MNIYTEFAEYMGPPGDKNIGIAMSGGVDSSTCAALMRQAGFNTVGITLQLNKDKISSCCSESDINDAREVALKMDFNHQVLNYSNVFKEHVIDDFVREYAGGRTPSPCVRCNQKVKFGQLIDFMGALDFEYIATGHYVMHRLNPVSKEIEFWRPKDKHKDQTYFMCLVPKDAMQKIRFPLGIYTKDEIRSIATEMGLKVARKRDSQDLCFVQNGKYAEVLKKLAHNMNRGLIINVAGEIVGHHAGIENYTVGQRKGIEVPGGPWFVVSIVQEENKLVIGRESDLLKNSFKVDSLNLTLDGPIPALLAQVRSRHKPIECILHATTGEVELIDENCCASPGQMCAFYLGDRLVGGGRIIA